MAASGLSQSMFGEFLQAAQPCASTGIGGWNWWPIDQWIDVRRIPHWGETRTREVKAGSKSKRGGRQDQIVYAIEDKDEAKR